MPTFTVSGKYEFRHFVEFCFAQEFQFQIRDEKEGEVITVGFHKGEWSLFVNPTKDYILFADNGSVRESNNLLYTGILEGLTEANQEDYDPRKTPANVLMKLICYFILESQQIRRMTDHFHVYVIQEGRNGFVDSTGELTLSPREEEFRFKI